jgi:hypothetical protein
MPQQIAPDLTQNLATFRLLEAPNTAPAALPFELWPLPQLTERELSARVQKILAPPSHGRRKIWEFDGNLHCSIIGTCLTNAELRQALGKLGLHQAENATEHDVHASGVLLAGKRHDGAKLLQRALDRRHRVAINQFARAKITSEVRALWAQSQQSCHQPPFGSVLTSAVQRLVPASAGCERLSPAATAIFRCPSCSEARSWS